MVVGTQRRYISKRGVLGARKWEWGGWDGMGTMKESEQRWKGRHVDDGWSSRRISGENSDLVDVNSSNSNSSGGEPGSS